MRHIIKLCKRYGEAKPYFVYLNHKQIENTEDFGIAMAEVEFIMELIEKGGQATYDVSIDPMCIQELKEWNEERHHD